MVQLRDRLTIACVHYHSEISSLADFFATAMEKHARDDPFWIESGFCRTLQDVDLLHTAITALVAAIRSVDSEEGLNHIERAFTIKGHLLRFFIALARFQSFREHIGDLFD